MGPRPTTSHENGGTQAGGRIFMAVLGGEFGDEGVEPTKA